jgi:hypothetical protein
VAEATQYSFDLRDLTEMLLRQQGIREGKWILGFNMGFGAATIGPTPEEVRPTAFVQINGANIARQPEDAPDSPLTVDAAEMKPPPPSGSRRKTKR